MLRFAKFMMLMCLQMRSSQTPRSHTCDSFQHSAVFSLCVLVALFYVGSRFNIKVDSTPR